jgi:hypothetical protein
MTQIAPFADHIVLRAFDAFESAVYRSIEKLESPNRQGIRPHGGEQ